MQVLVGDPYGQLHSLDIYTKEQVETFGQLTKQCPIKLIYSPEERYYYFASANKIICHSNEELTEMEMKTGASIIGLASDMQDRLLYSYSDGSICSFKNDPNQENEEEMLFQLTKEEGWLKGWLSPYQKSMYCMVGRSLPPQVVDLEREVVCWSGKNVPNDQLELKVPIFDVDGLFYNEGNNLATLHKQRKVRLYDVKKGQRRPILDVEFKEEKTNFTNFVESVCSNYFLIGNAQGSVFISDRRKDLKVCGKLKGANGTIKGLTVLSNGYVLTASLDSYLRLYNLSDNKIVTSVYLGHPIYSLYARGDIDEDKLEDAKEQAAQAPKPKAPKRKNTVALPYLQPRKQLKKEQAGTEPKEQPAFDA